MFSPSLKIGVGYGILQLVLVGMANAGQMTIEEADAVYTALQPQPVADSPSGVQAQILQTLEKVRSSNVG